MRVTAAERAVKGRYPEACVEPWSPRLGMFVVRMFPGAMTWIGAGTTASEAWRSARKRLGIGIKRGGE